MTETWSPIPGYETLYAVSEEGRIKSLRNGRVLAPVLDGHGYPTVRLYRAGADRRYLVHRLVAAAFHGDKQNVLHHEAAHLDGNPLNARADNLKWVSPAENAHHKRMHGTHQAGEKHPRAKLAAEDISDIRASAASNCALSRQYRVNESAIRKIRNGERWKGESAGLEEASPNTSSQTPAPKE